MGNQRFRTTRFAWGLALGALLGLLTAGTARAETLAAAECFFDTDPGEGKGISLPATDGAFDSAEEEADLSMVVPADRRIGPHTLFVRFKSASGVWGLARPLVNDASYLAPYNLRVAGSKWVAGAEYFFDTDPGEGNATQAAAADGAFDEAEEEVVLTGLDVAALAPGVHKLFVRFRDNEGTWGPARQTALQTFGLAAAEYYVDTDPGVGKATSLAALDGAFDSGAEEAGVSEVPTLSLSEGGHSAYARFRDAFGVWGAAVPATFAKDSLPPVVAITSPANGSLTKNKTPPLAYEVTDANPTTEVVTVDGKVTAKTSGQALDALADGSHTVAVESTDGAGNKGSASVTFMVDTVPPAVGLTSPSPGVTTNRAPTLTYTVDDATATVVVKVDGIAVTTRTGQALAPLADGPHTVVVEATDPAGNKGTHSVTFTVDTMPPVIVVTSPVNASVTNDKTPTLTYTVDDAAAAIVVKVDGTPVTTRTDQALAALAEGPHAVKVEATDAAGNKGAATVTFTVDTVPPAVAISSPGSNPTNNRTPTLNYTVDDAAATIVVKVDGTPVATRTRQALAALSEGPHTVTVEATDAATNKGSASVTFTVDTVAPVVAVTAPANGAKLNTKTPVLTYTVDDVTAPVVVKVDGTVVATRTGQALAALAEGSRTVTVEATDAAGNKGSASVTFTVDTVAPVVAISSPTGNPTKNKTPTLAYTVDDASATVVVKVDGTTVVTRTGQALSALSEGPHTVTVEAADVVGNKGTTSVTFTVDTVAPVVAVTAPTNGAKLNTKTPTLTYNVDDAAATVVVKVDGTAVSTRTGQALAALAEGRHTVTVEATDLAGNTGPASTTFTVDSVAPVVAITGPKNGSALSTKTPTLGYTIDDSTAAVVVKVDDWEVPTRTGQLLSALADGQHTVKVTATDEVHNVATTTSVFTIDTQVPVVTIQGPASGATLYACTPTLTYTVNEAGAKVEVKVDGTAVAKTSGQALGCLAEGPHTVAVEATDAAVNKGQAVSSFTVETVVRAPSNLVVPASTPPGSYTLTWAASGTPEAGYDVQEATDAAFASPVVVYSGPGLSAQVTKPTGGASYYYRVRAVREGMTASPWVDGSNRCVVTLGRVTPPLAITVPAASGTDSYTVKWKASKFKKVTYELEEAADTAFTQGRRTVAKKTSAVVSLPPNNATYYYRVRAVRDQYSPSDWVVGTNGCAVRRDVAPPAKVTVPKTSKTGAYKVSWSASKTRGVLYELQEATDAGFTLDLRTAPVGTARSMKVEGRQRGVTYYYRVKASREGYNPTAWIAGSNGCLVPAPLAKEAAGQAAPPVAAAGPDRTVEPGGVVVLDGSNSTAAEGGALFYRWEQVGAGPRVALTGADRAKASFSASEAGADGQALGFVLTVTDEAGESGADEVVVNVTTGNLPPVAEAGEDVAVPPGSEVTLDASASTDPEGQVLSYLWTQVEGAPVALEEATALTVTFAAPAVGGDALVFELAVADPAGLVGTDRVVVNVLDSAGEKPPTAAVAAPAEASAGAVVTLDGSSSAAGSWPIAAWRWVQTAGTPVTLSAPTGSTTTFVAPEAGRFAFELWVTDAAGLTGRAGTEVVVVP